MSNNAESILVFFGDEAAISSPEVRRGLGDAMKNAASRVSEVAVSTMQENMRRFLTSLDTIIGTSPKEVGGLTLDEVEIHAQIDSNGNIGITGIAGAEFATQGGIKFVLRKRV